MKKPIMIAVLMMMFGLTARSESTEVPSLEHILEVLEYAGSKVKNVDMEVEVRWTGRPGAPSYMQREVYRHVYDDRGRMYHRFRKQIQEPEDAPFWDANETIYTYDGAESTRYHPAKKNPEDYVLLRWDGINVSNLYLGGELPGDHCHILGKSLPALISERMAEGRPPTIEKIEDNILLTFEDMEQGVMGPTKLFIELDPEKEFFMTRKELYHREKLVDRAIIMPRLVNGIYHWNRAYRQTFYDTDSGVHPQYDYYVMKIRVNEDYTPDSLFIIDKEESDGTRD